MFENSRRKIVAAIMTILVLLWVGTLGVIYTSSYMEMAEQNKQMLMEHANHYLLSRDEGELINDLKGHAEKNAPGGNLPTPEELREFDKKDTMFRLSVFYTVALSYEDQVLDVDTGTLGLHDEAELEALAKEIVAEGKQTGTKQDLMYYQTDKGGYRLVTFMDNAILNARAASLLRYTLIFGAVALVLFFFLSIWLARKIVAPLEESYIKQKQFISDAGHELKTPVSVVSANAELLAREVGENPWLANIQYENQRMGMLVKQLLELARTEQMTAEMGPVDLSHLCKGELLPFESVAYEKYMELVGDVADGIYVEGNLIQLKQLVSILLDNALEHSSADGLVSLRLRKEHGKGVLSVLNRGDAIPEKQREQLFERFYRTDTARTGDGAHYGLGLAIAKAIVHGHKGQIQVHCYDGLVEFRIHFPLLASLEPKK